MPATARRPDDAVDSALSIAVVTALYITVGTALAVVSAVATAVDLVRRPRRRAVAALERDLHAEFDALVDGRTLICGTCGFAHHGRPGGRLQHEDDGSHWTIYTTGGAS